MSDIIDAFTINQYPASFDKEQFSYIPTMLEKKIIFIVTAILLILAACYASYHYLSSRKKSKIEKEKPVAKKIENSENQLFLKYTSLREKQEHPPSNYNFNQIVITPNEKRSEIEPIINIQNKNQRENYTLKTELQTFYDNIKNEKPIEVSNGYNEITKSDGTYLRGTFINNLLEGEGEKRFTNGDYQSGTFANNELNGSGIKQCDGIAYEGTFENGRLKEGEIKYPGGRLEKGKFENDLLEGEGEKIIPGQGIMKGIFNQGKLNGLGKIEFEDGVVWEGTFIDNLLNGKGIMIMNNGITKLEGMFIKNVFQREKTKNTN